MPEYRPKFSIAIANAIGVASRGLRKGREVIVMDAEMWDSLSVDEQVRGIYIKRKAPKDAKWDFFTHELGREVDGRSRANTNKARTARQNLIDRLAAVGISVATHQIEDPYKFGRIFVDAVINSPLPISDLSAAAEHAEWLRGNLFRVEAVNAG